MTGQQAQLPGFLALEDDWRMKASCREHPDPDLWFPEPMMQDNYRLAKRVCYECPVRTECLTWALANNEVFGVWGGFTEYERYSLLNREKRS